MVLSADNPHRISNQNITTNLSIDLNCYVLADVNIVPKG